MLAPVLELAVAAVVAVEFEESCDEFCERV